ncbi:uncharacterized protein LOC116587223 [Mustela erminea]|uniref:uncharacterized protein LOC116587223 n=1 Tax=Mustela erminea TaxID=36723 RepID=UPI0013871B18|nr:uncharacterized protein LOC116587223 [Mustela erminea]
MFGGVEVLCGLQLALLQASWMDPPRVDRALPACLRAGGRAGGGLPRDPALNRALGGLRCGVRPAASLAGPLACALARRAGPRLPGAREVEGPRRLELSERRAPRGCGAFSRETFSRFLNFIPADSVRAPGPLGRLPLWRGACALFPVREWRGAELPCEVIVVCGFRGRTLLLLPPPPKLVGLVDLRFTEAALRLAGPRARVRVGCRLSLTGSGWEGAPHPSGLLACTKLTFVVKLLRLLVLVDRTRLTLVRIQLHPFTHGHAVYFAAFVGKTVISSLNGHDTLTENHFTVNVSVCFWMIYLFCWSVCLYASTTYIIVCQYYFDNCSFVLN